MAKAYKNEFPVSRNELLEADIYSLLVTFRKASKKVYGLLKPGDSPVYNVLIEDLERLGITDTI
jgi:hypothetical protein